DERPFGDEALAARARTSEIIASFSNSNDGRDGRVSREAANLDAELIEEQASSAAMASLLYEIDLTTQPAPANGRRDIRRGIEFSPSMLSELRPHVVNLNQRRFSSTGQFENTPDGVDAIFGQDLARELQAA